MSTDGPEVADGEAAAAETGDAEPAASASPTANFLAALEVRRNGLLGGASGLVLAVAVYAYFVAIPAVVPAVPARDTSPALFLLLAFVVAVTTAMLVATVLTAVRAVRLSRELD